MHFTRRANAKRLVIYLCLIGVLFAWGASIASALQGGVSPIPRKANVGTDGHGLLSRRPP